MRVKDYTTLPLGTSLDAGSVEKCPECGEPGLKEQVGGKTFYTHREWCGFTETGSPDVGFVWHSLDSKSSAP